MLALWVPVALEPYELYSEFQCRSPNAHLERRVSDDYDWGEFKKGVTPLTPRLTANRAYGCVRPCLVSIQQYSALANSVSSAMQRKQQANLVSHIYANSGIGAPPISGGKFELHSRSKHF